MSARPNELKYCDLLKLAPNGLITTELVTANESKRLRITFNKEMTILPRQTLYILCIKGLCRENILTQNAKSAKNFMYSHYNKQHENEKKESLDKEVLLHSHLVTAPCGDKKKFVKHYKFIQITGYTKFKWLRISQSPFDLNMNNKESLYYPEIDLNETKSVKISPSSLRNKDVGSENVEHLPLRMNDESQNDEMYESKMNEQVISSNDICQEILREVKSLKVKINEISSNKHIAQKPVSSQMKITNFINNTSSITIDCTSRKKKYYIPRKGMSFYLFSQKKGKYLVSIEFNGANKTFSAFCILCNKYNVELKDEFGAHLLGPMVTGIVMDFVEMEDEKFWLKHWNKIYCHYNKSPVHVFAVETDKKKQKYHDDVLTLHADIVYGQLLHSSSNIIFEEKIILFHNVNVRKKQKLCEIGDFYHDQKQCIKWRDLYYDYILSVHRKIATRGRGVCDVVIIGGSMDGVTSGSMKVELISAFIKNPDRMRVVTIGCDEFEYDGNTKKVKDVKSSVTAFYNALCENGMAPTIISDDDELTEYEQVIIFRNLCLDGAYLWEQDKTEDIEQDGDVKEDVVEEEEQEKQTKKPAIDRYIKQIIPLSPFVIDCIHDPIHGNELDSKSALKDVLSINECDKCYRTGTRVLRHPKQIKKLKNLDRKYKKYRTLCPTRFIEYSQMLDRWEHYDDDGLFTLDQEDIDQK